MTFERDCGPLLSCHSIWVLLQRVQSQANERRAIEMPLYTIHEVSITEGRGEDSRKGVHLAEVCNVVQVFRATTESMEFRKAA